MVREVERRPAAVRLMEHPGVGPVTALAFVATIGPIRRFRNSKQLVSYLGLNPREHSSGGKQRLGSISKQGNSMVRFLLVEARALRDLSSQHQYRSRPQRQGSAMNGPKKASDRP